MSRKTQHVLKEKENAAKYQMRTDAYIDAHNGTKPMNGKEMRVIELLAAMDSRIVEAGDCMRERLKAIPNGWRQWRLMASIVGKL